MINLFDRVYIRHDNILTRGQGQQLLIVTDRNRQVNYVTDPAVQREIGIIGIYDSLSDLDHYMEGREQLWTMLRLKATKVLIIARKDHLAELLIQYWKSIFVTTSVGSLYALYKLFIGNENMHTYRETERAARASSPALGEELIEKLSLEEFTILYDRTQPVEALNGLEKRHIPFEYLLMAYLADRITNDDKKVFFAKIDQIMRTNIISRIASAREELLFETHNYYLVEPDTPEALIDDPLGYLGNHPSLAWIVDNLFVSGSEDEILAKYSMAQIKHFFQVYQTMIPDHQDELLAIGWLQNKQYGELIRHDVQDQRGNYFATKAFVNKINGWLVSYMYQLKRLEQMSWLSLYQLK